MILSNIKPRCRSQGWEERAHQIFSVLFLLQQCHPSHFQPSTTASLQFYKDTARLCQQNKRWYCCSKQDTWPKEHSSLSSCFFGKPGVQQKWCLPQEIHATRSSVLRSWEQPLFLPRARCHCFKQLWLPSSKLHPRNTTQGPAGPSTPSSTSRLH